MQWFRAFLEPVPAERTEAEVAAIASRLPRPDFTRVLDLCCGTGRHATRLSAMGYQVTGVDRNEGALQVARRRAPEATFVCIDMRDLGDLSGPFDGAAILWQSFGYFSAAENDAVLHSIAQLLRPGGRLLLDVFHPGYFARHQGLRSSVPAGVVSIEDCLEGDRLKSQISYPDGSMEVMDFELYAPDELTERANRQGFGFLEVCTLWDPGRSPDPDESRYQLTLERRIG